MPAKALILTIILVSFFSPAWAKTRLGVTLLGDNASPDMVEKLVRENPTLALHIPVVVSKDKKLVIWSGAEFSPGQCVDTKGTVVDRFSTVYGLDFKAIKKLKCSHNNGQRMSFYHLEQIIEHLISKKLKPLLFIEGQITPALSSSTPSTTNFAKYMRKAVKNYDYSKLVFISKSMRLLRKLKGEVNQKFNIVFKNDSDDPGYLQLALYYNMWGIAPHVHWIYKEDVRKIRKYQKKKVRTILWGVNSPYSKRENLKSNPDFLIVDNPTLLK